MKNWGPTLLVAAAILVRKHVPKCQTETVRRRVEAITTIKASMAGLPLITRLGGGDVPNPALVDRLSLGKIAMSGESSAVLMIVA